VRVCFFAKVRFPAELDRVEFYAQDLRVLEALGYEVIRATRLRDLRRADLFVVWWWTWAAFPVCLAKLLGKPVIVTGVFDFWKYPSRTAAHRFLHRFALRQANANVFVSRFEYEEVPRELSARGPHHIPLAIDVETYHPGLMPREDFILTTAKMIGGNGARKCIGEIVRAAPLIRRAHPEVRFVLAGELDPRYLVLARDLGAESYIEFPGVIDLATKVDLMQRCRVYMQPTRFEGFGLAIAEALACGAPVVTSRVGAVPEVVGADAVFVDGCSPESIARGTIQLLNDRALQQGLSEQGPRRIRQLFSYEAHCRDWAALIETIV
jgi:glycosyltransferase involved in cell wall biosynthesis